MLHLGSREIIKKEVAEKKNKKRRAEIATLGKMSNLYQKHRDL